MAFSTMANEKYCQLFFAAKMGASGSNLANPSFRSLTLNNKNTHSEKGMNSFSSTKLPGICLLTSNVLIIRFVFFLLPLKALSLYLSTHKIGIEKIYVLIFSSAFLFLRHSQSPKCPFIMCVEHYL